MTDLDSPNIHSLDRWAFDVRKVEKPWGYELIWALTEVYCGKVLFVKAGSSLSLQFHNVKDESWLVQSGRATLELGEVGQKALNEEVIGAGGGVPLQAGHGAPRHGDRGHHDPRGLDTASRGRCPARGSLREGRDLRAVGRRQTLPRLW